MCIQYIIHIYLIYNSGEIHIKPSVIIDYETAPIYIVEVTASDGVLQDMKNLTITIDDVNEEPFFTVVTKLADIMENEITSRVVIDLDASDPENDVLFYKILGSSPFEAPFTIDSSNGEFANFIFLRGNKM